MKKTLIALAVAALASSAANATVIYQKDGTKIDLDGRVHFELVNKKNKRTDLEDPASRVRVRAYQEIGGGFTAYGGAELRFSKGDGSPASIGGNFRTHRLYAGLIHKDIGTLTFGSQLHLGDHIPKANYTYEYSGGNVFFDSHKKAVTFMSTKLAGVRLAADYYFGEATKTKSSGTKGWNEGQGYGLGFFYDGKFGDNLAVRFGSGFTEVTQSTDGTKENEYKLKRAGIGFDIKYRIVTLGVDWAYGKASKDQNSANIGFQKVANNGHAYNSNNRFLVGFKVDVTEQNAIYGQYLFGTAKFAKDAGKEKMRGWGLGVDHKFNKNVLVYVEGGTGRIKQADDTTFKNHKVAVGARVMF